MINTTYISDNRTFDRVTSRESVSMSMRSKEFGVIINFTEHQAEIYINCGIKAGSMVKVGTFGPEDVTNLRDERDADGIGDRYCPYCKIDTNTLDSVEEGLICAVCGADKD